MVAADYTLYIDQGSDFSQEFAFKDPTTGDPIVLTGYAADAQVWENYDATAELFTFTTVVDGAAGTITISCTPTQTNALTLTRPNGTEDTPWELVWDLFITAPGIGGAVTRVLKGKVELYPKVTVA